MMKKKKFFIYIFILCVISIVLLFYFSQSKWYKTRGSSGSYSKDTYLEDGEGMGEYNDKIRIYYNYAIETGGIHFELVDKNGKKVYEIDITESSSGYMTFEDLPSGIYYEHEYALTQDTVATSDKWWEQRITNFQRLLMKVNKWTGYRLLGRDYLE